MADDPAAGDQGGPGVPFVVANNNEVRMNGRKCFVISGIQLLLLTKCRMLFECINCFRLQSLIFQ